MYAVTMNSMESNVSILSATSVGDTFITVNFSDFRIISSTGKYALFKDGTKTEGDLNTKDPMYLNEENEALQLMVILPDLTVNDSYTIQPISVLTPYKIIMRCMDVQKGFYSSIKMDNGGSVTFDANGSISVLCNNPSYISASLTTNGSGRELYTLSAEGL